MTSIIILITFSVALFAWFFFIGPARRRRRYRAVMDRPFPGSWQAYLAREVSLYRRMPVAYKPRLQGLIHLFLEEKRFEGCGGLNLTEEMKLAIAAQACVPALARRPPPYPGLISVLVYPGAYRAKQARPVGGPAWMEEETVRAGESWKGGEVVLAWAEVEEDGRMAYGRNVVLHEFAHQLDQESGQADGAPVMDSPSQHRAWKEASSRALLELRRAVDQGRATALDPYGAENPAEFFACAVEAFFVKPKELKAEEPELYEQLEDYFLLDPAGWE